MIQDVESQFFENRDAYRIRTLAIILSQPISRMKNCFIDNESLCNDLKSSLKWNTIIVIEFHLVIEVAIVYLVLTIYEL